MIIMQTSSIFYSLIAHIPVLNNPVFDPAVWFYALSLAAIIPGFILMMWWLFYMKFNTSFIYKALTFLYFGAGASIGFGLYIRFLRHTDPESGVAIVFSYIFGWHIAPVAIGFWVMTIRLYYQWWSSWLVSIGKKKCQECGKIHITSPNHPLRRDSDIFMKFWEKLKTFKKRRCPMNWFTVACIAYKLGGRQLIKKLISSDKTTLDEMALKEFDRVTGYQPKKPEYS